MLRPEELLKFVDIINRKLIELDFIFLNAVGSHKQFITHQRAFQHPKMLDAPFGYILLGDIILEDVKE